MAQKAQKVAASPSPEQALGVVCTQRETEGCGSKRLGEGHWLCRQETSASVLFVPHTS